MSTQIVGAISNAIASLQVTQRFVNHSSESHCEMTMSQTDGYVIYDINVVKGRQQVSFNIHEFDDEYMTRVGEYNTMGFQSSVTDLRLNLGEVQPKDIVQVTYGVTFTAIFAGETSLCFQLPHNSAHNRTTAFMALSVENEHGVQKVTTPGHSSKFADAKLTMKKVELQGPPLVVVTTERPISSVGVGRVIDNDLFVTLELRPEEQGRATPPAELFFLLDKSGSMGGSKLANAVQALESIIRGIPETHYFNVVYFDSSFTPLYAESQLATKERIQEATQQLHTIVASGGTNLLSPLEFVYSKPPRAGFVRQLFILTDGIVEKESDILHLISTHRANHRLFSLGIGSDVARAFVEEIATRTGGNSAFVDPRDIQAAVNVQVAASGSPAIVNVQVHAGDDEAVELTPFPVSPLFHNRITHVFLRWKNRAQIPASMLVTGVVGDEQFEQNFPVTVTEAAIEMKKMFAFFNIKDMETRIPALTGRQLEGLRANVVQLSKEARLISAFTAMFTMVDGVELHLQPSLGQERFGFGMQAFTQDQCRGQERFSYLRRRGP